MLECTRLRQSRFRHPEGRRLRGSEVNDFVIAYEARGISSPEPMLSRERVCRRTEFPPASE
jgi:hypothetical protein